MNRRERIPRTCFCHTCNKDFHWLGIARHRAMHRDRNEDCVISYSDGRTYRYRYSENMGSEEGIRMKGNDK